MRLNYRILTVVLLSTPVAAAAQQAPPKLDAYVRRVMETFTVPGLSVAIVKDGKVVLAKGYGVRRMGNSAPVDAKHPLRHRFQHQALHGYRAGPAGRGG